MSLPGLTCQCGLKKTGMRLKNNQDQDLLITIEKGGNEGRSITSVLGDRFKESTEKTPGLYIVVNKSMDGH